MNRHAKAECLPRLLRAREPAVPKVGDGRCPVSPALFGVDMETALRARAVSTPITACAPSLTPSPAAAGSVSAPACDFRAATVEALFGAANEADLAAAALEAGDGAGAASRLGAGADLLL